MLERGKLGAKACVVSLNSMSSERWNEEVDPRQDSVLYRVMLANWY